MTITPQRLHELTEALAEGRSVALAAGEAAALCALVQAAFGALSGLLDDARKLELKPGDLLVVTAAAETPSEYASLRASLEMVAEAFQVRIVALNPEAKLETVPEPLLNALGSAIVERIGRGVADRETRARIVAEAASDLGLVLKQSVRQ